MSSSGQVPVWVGAALVLALGCRAGRAGQDVGASPPVADAAAKPAAAKTAYACIRVVRKEPGRPGKPEITLPAGYSLVTRGQYEVASAGEYYVFLQGPAGVARGVKVRWPGLAVRAVIQGHDRLELRREGEAVVCDIPVAAPSLRSAWSTLAIWSSLPQPGLPIRIEHNHPDRRAGKYARGSWVAGQAAACVNYLFACREILRDWGLHRQIQADKLGSLSLMGFESNNPLHGDWPAHWHLIYYWPASREPGTSPYHGSQVPHFYMDAEGRTVSNSIHVFDGKGRVAKAGDPMIFTDPKGKVRLAIQIRADGGVDLGPATGNWTYSIVAGHGRGRFTESVRVLRSGKPWIRVASTDDAAAGVLTVRLTPLAGPGKAVAETHRYDPLTGRPIGRKP